MNYFRISFALCQSKVSVASRQALAFGASAIALATIPLRVHLGQEEGTELLFGFGMDAPDSDAIVQLSYAIGPRQRRRLRVFEGVPE